MAELLCQCPDFTQLCECPHKTPHPWTPECDRPFNHSCHACKTVGFSTEDEPERLKKKVNALRAELERIRGILRDGGLGKHTTPDIDKVLYENPEERIL